MLSAEYSEIDQLIEQIQAWPADWKIMLVRRVLETIESPLISVPRRVLTLDQVVGMIAIDNQALNDEACDRIVSEERDKKYGC